MSSPQIHKVLNKISLYFLFGVGLWCLSFTLAFASVVPSRSLTTNPNLASGLVGHWTFDGPNMINNVSDLSGSYATGSLVMGSTGTLTATTTISGRIGQALQFDGTDDYVNATGFVWPTGGPVTVSFWNYVKTSDAKDSSAFGSNDTSNFSNRFHSHAPFSDKVLYWDYGGASGAARISTNYTAYLDRWTYVTLVSQGNGGNFKAIYFDGKLVTSAASSDGPDASVTGMFIGRWSSYHRGRIDDFRIYNRVLNAAEITRLYHLGATTRIARSITTNPNLASGLVGHWTFDGPNMINNVVDLSSSYATGSLVMGSSGTLTTTTTMPGRIGQAVRLDGNDDYVNLSNVSALNPAAITVSAWVKPLALSNAYNTIVHRGNGSTYYEFFIKSNGKIAAYLNNPSALNYDGSGVHTLTVNNWYHVVFTYDSVGGLNAYVNNVLDKNVGANGTMGSVSADALVGKDAVTGGRLMNGIFDDVRIYNRVLNVAEITRLYHLGATTRIARSITTNPTLSSASGLIGHWTFDGPNLINNIADISGSSATGSLIVGSSGTLTATTTTPGRIGQALQFDGTDDYVTIADSVPLRPNNVSISAWFKLDATPTNKTIVSKAYNGPPWSSPFVSWLIRANSLTVLETDVGNGTSYSAKTWTVNLKLNKWHHVVMTYNGTTLTAYLDNVSLGTNTTISGNIGYGTPPVLIGADFGSSPTGGNFPGIIDDVHVYNRALNVGEISRLYDLGK